MHLLPYHTWVHLPAYSKVDILTTDCGEGKCSVYCRHQRVQTANAKTHSDLPMALGKGF